MSMLISRCGSFKLSDYMINANATNDDEDVVASIMLDAASAFDQALFDGLVDEAALYNSQHQQQQQQHQLTTTTKDDSCSTPMKQNSALLNCANVSENLLASMTGKVRTPTPLKHAMARIKLKEEQKQRLRLKGQAMRANEQFSDSGYLSFNENVVDAPPPPADTPPVSLLAVAVATENICSHSPFKKRRDILPTQTAAAFLRLPTKVPNCNNNVNDSDMDSIMLGKTSDQLSLTEKARSMLNNIHMLNAAAADSTSCC